MDFHLATEAVHTHKTDADPATPQTLKGSSLRSSFGCRRVVQSQEPVNMLPPCGRERSLSAAAGLRALTGSAAQRWRGVALGVAGGVGGGVVAWVGA